MKKFLLLTNNPRFNSLNFDKVEINFFEDKNYLEMFYKVRDLIHLGYRLLTHPLYGNFRPRDTLFRTFIVVKDDKLDVDSLMLVEDAIKRAEHTFNETVPRRMTDSIISDLSEIDMELILPVLNNL